MPYEKKIQRAEPGLIVLVLDDSGSMGLPLAGTSDKKHQWVDRYTQHIMRELLARSTEPDGDAYVVKPRYFVQAVIYGTTPSIWQNQVVDIEKALDTFTANGRSFGLAGALGGTDSDTALRMACDVVSQALASERFSRSFPPMVFHLTDGESQTDPSIVAEQIKQLRSSDGNVLLVNAFIGAQTSLQYTDHADFPGYVDVSEVGASADTQRLFHASSIAPDTIIQNLRDDGIFPNMRQGARLFFDVRTKEMLRNVIQVVGSSGSRTRMMM